MNAAESQALRMAQEAALVRCEPTHRFTAADICDLQWLWLGAIFPWAGELRSINIGKGGLQFAHAGRIPHLMVRVRAQLFATEYAMSRDQ